MKNFSKQDFDEIFKAGLTAPDMNEIDEDWALMKARLQNQKTRSLVPHYMIWISSVAAVLLLVFALIFNPSEQGQEPVITAVKVEDASSIEIPVVNSTENIAKSNPEDDKLMPGNTSIGEVAKNYKSTFNSNPQVIEHVEFSKTSISNSTETFAVEGNKVATEIAPSSQALAAVEPATADLNTISALI